MTTWGDTLEEIQRRAADGTLNIDEMRRERMLHLADLTGRSLIVYGSDFLASGGQQTSIELNDMQGLMEVFRLLPGPNLDIILHSPGGQAEATERLVRYTRSKFDHVRVIVPMVAMSAATMWAMSADEIVMGRHSQLGPIDPQITLPSGIPTPAGALLEQFQTAADECTADPARVTAWLPTLQQYPPGLLNICQSASDLAKQLVAEWLSGYMFAGEPDAEAKAKSVAEWLGDDKHHLSHSRAITREQLIDHGVKVTALEDPQDFQEAVLSVFHALSHTMSAGTAVKIVENHMGRRWIQHGGMMMAPPVAIPAPGPVAPGMPPAGP